LKGGACVLFADTFTNYGEPEIGLAARDVLRGAGIDVGLTPHVCCGRPLISQGLLDDARALAVKNVVALHEVAARGDTIVFLEPSCLSALREDVPALLRGTLQHRAHEIARASMLFEDYLESEWLAGRAHLPLTCGPASVLLHAHCHQRAMGLASSARALLARIPGATVTDLDAGCCGMAGSFGYTKEHYDVSRAIGELKLFPTARAMDPVWSPEQDTLEQRRHRGSAREHPRGSVLVAAGTSCRHQVEHFTGVRPMHPARLFASLLAVRTD
jgi:Fe-S oxidoreductase